MDFTPLEMKIVHKQYKDQLGNTLELTSFLTGKTGGVCYYTPGGLPKMTGEYLFSKESDLAYLYLTVVGYTFRFEIVDMDKYDVNVFKLLAKVLVNITTAPDPS